MNFDDDDDFDDFDDDDFDDEEDELPPFLQGRRGYLMITRDTLSILAEICLQCRPDGIFYRGEYMSHHPDHEDEPESLCINLQTGRWSDIAANAQGFDPVTYYAHVKGLSVVAAIKALSEKLDEFFGCEPEPRVVM